MVRPRVFVSSTYYDLKYIRSSLENFINTLGFDSILSEKGDIPFSSEIPLDESCYREVENADIFIIIIGGRYGSEIKEDKEHRKNQFYDRYESITKNEYQNAVKRNIPIYIFVEKSVYSDYETFLKNKTNNSVNYAHVDSINIFYFIEKILSQPKNNPICQFDRYDDIEVWLKEQWAGLFRELINQRSKQTQLTSLTSQVSLLAEINQTLKLYIEKIMTKVSPDSVGLILSESERLDGIKQEQKLEKTNLYQQLLQVDILKEDLKSALIASSSYDDFIKKLDKISIQRNPELPIGPSDILMPYWIDEINEAREILGLNPFEQGHSD